MQFFVSIALAVLLMLAPAQADVMPSPQAMTSIQDALHTWSPDAFSSAIQQLRQQRDLHPQSPSIHYWLGVAHFHRMLLHQSAASPNPSAAEESAKAAETCFAATLELDPSHAEAHALAGILIGMRIDGIIDGIRLGPTLQRHQRAALKFGPTNPRVRYLLGSGLFHTAKDDPEKLRTALRTLEYAARLFEQEATTPAQPGQPRWGAGSCHMFIGRCHEALGNLAQAIQAYRRALTLQPANHFAAKAIARLTAPQ